MPTPIRDESIADEIGKLHDMHKEGALTQDEFYRAKQQALSSASSQVASSQGRVTSHSTSVDKSWTGMRIVIVTIVALIGGLWLIGELFL